MKSNQVNPGFITRGFLYGAFSCVVLVGVAYLGLAWAGMPFPPFRLFDLMTRILPGAVITTVIDLIVGAITALKVGPTSVVAKAVEQAIAVFQFIVLGGLAGALLGYLRSKVTPRRLPIWGLALGLAAGLALALIDLYLGGSPGSPVVNFTWLLVVMAIWGTILGWFNQYAAEDPSASAPPAGQKKVSRREAMVMTGTGLAALVVSALAYLFLSGRRREQQPDVAQNPPTPLPDAALDNRIPPAPGTRPELTSNQNFYRIDINALPPLINADEWNLVLDGMVNHPMTLTLDDIRARPKFSQYITLSCISNSVGGDLISTSLWAGARLKDLLDEAGLQTGAGELAIQSVDGFYESVSEADMSDPRTLLVYEMNGEPLPPEHGFPLRIYIPNRYGMKQPKWITHMQVIAGKGPGYWVDRGWSPNAFVRTTSVIDVVNPAQSGESMLLAGGIAYSGARKISKVEVQVDDGPWAAAELRVPPLSDLTWVQWRLSLDNLSAGQHIAQVRAYNGAGEVQFMEYSPPHPDGASGYHRFDFTI